MPSCPHGHVDYTTGPDIDGSGVELTSSILLGRYVRSRATESGCHMRLLLPSHAETLSVAEVGNLECTMGSKQEVLRLQVSMSHAHFMHILDTAHKLFEVAVRLEHLEGPSSKNQGVEVTAGAILHDFAVVTLGVLQQVQGVNDIGMA